MYLAMPPKPKTEKRKCAFTQEQTKQFPCFSMGKTALERHISSRDHKARIRDATSSMSMEGSVVKTQSDCMQNNLKETNGNKVTQGMSGRSRRLEERTKQELRSYDDPLDTDMNISVKNEVICPDMLPSEDEDILGMVDGQGLVEEQQKMQRLYPLEAGSIEHLSLNDRLSSLERKVDFLLNVNTKILARVDKICENMKTVTKPNDFPVKHKDALEVIDMKIANDREKYTELFKNLLSPSGIVKNIGRIIDPKLLMEMNYGGHSSKAGLSNYINLNTALYESQRREGYTFDDYKKDARTAFQKAKNRVYKAISEARRMKRLNNELMESKNQIFNNNTNIKDTME